MFVAATRADQQQLQVGEERLGLLPSQALVGDHGGARGGTVGGLVGQQLPGLLPLAPQLGLARPNPVMVPPAVVMSMSLTPQ